MKKLGPWAWLPGIVLVVWLLWSQNGWGLVGAGVGFGYGYLVASRREKGK